MKNLYSSLAKLKSIDWDLLLDGEPLAVIKELINHANNNNDEARELIEHLNAVSGSRFVTTSSNLTLANSRLHDYHLDDLKSMVSRKVKDWSKTDMEKYLRPATLFNAMKCDQYMGERAVKKIIYNDI